MAIDTFLGRAINHLPISVLIIALPILLAFFVLTTVRLYTTHRYRKSLAIQCSSAAESTKANPPPPIPYTIPFLGHAIAFLAPRPGEFWAKLFRYHPRATGACTLLLGGNHTHILFSPNAVQALFKARGQGRDGFNRQVAELAFGMERKEATRFFGLGEGPDHTGMTPVQQQERMNTYLLDKKSVDELTAGFTRVLQEQLSVEELSSKGEADYAMEGKVERLCSWLQTRMFQASTTVFMGSHILEVYPDLCADFWDFDAHVLTMFFRVPKFLNPTAYRVREKMLKRLTQWQEQMHKECDGNPVDPDGDIDWEPIYGSRATRARQRYYASRGLNIKTRASIDFLYLFGLSSNANPAAGWMLMHILNPQGDASLCKRVMDEIASAQRADGSLDIAILVALPLFQSIFYETLRLYVDVPVTRELKEDLTLPLDDTGARNVFLHKNSVILARPGWATATKPSGPIPHPSVFQPKDSSPKTPKQGNRSSRLRGRTANSSPSAVAKRSVPAGSLRSRRCL